MTRTIETTLETNQRNSDNSRSTQSGNAGAKPVPPVSNAREILEMNPGNGSGGNGSRRDRREALRQQIAKLEAKLTQENRREQGKSRKRDTQLKIVAGAILLADVEAGNTARPQVVEMFKRGARRERDVKLLQEEGWL